MDEIKHSAVLSQIKDDIVEILRELMPTDECELRMSVDNNDLSALGLNSFTYVELVVSIEHKFGFEFEDDMLSLETLNDLNTLILYIFNKI